MNGTQNECRCRLNGLRQHSAESNSVTISKLKKAMIEICRYKSYRDITVTELCRKAGVSRMGFYRNFAVVSDIFDALGQDINKAVKENLGSPFRLTTTRDWYINIFQMVIQNRDLVTVMTQESFQYQWLRTVNAEMLHDDTFSPERKYQRLCWCGGMINVLTYWLRNKMKETPQELADYCIAYLPHLMAEEKAPLPDN